MTRLLLLLLFLPACAGPLDLVVAVPPGRIADLETHFAPAFEARAGARIVAVGLRSGDQAARVRIERGAPSLDALWIDAGEATLLAREGLIEGPDDDLAEVAAASPAFRFAQGALPAAFASAIGFLYNANALPDPPRSWAALAEPRLAGRLALFSFGSTLGPLTVGVLARIATGDETDADAGFGGLAGLRRNVLRFGASGPANNQLVAQGEAWLTLGLPSQARQLADAGAPVAWLAPEEGAAALPQGIQIVAGGPNRELARAFADFMFSREAQTAAARDLQLVPAREDVPLPEGLPAPDALLHLDVAALGALRSAWTVRFRREALAE